MKNLFIFIIVVFFLIGCSKQAEVVPCVLNPISPTSTPWILSTEGDNYVRAVSIHNSFAFIELDKSLVVLDINDPLKPITLGSYLGWTVPFMVRDNLAYSFWNEELHILDISNPDHLVEVGCPGIDHQVLKNAQFSINYAFDPKGVEGLKIYDLSELASPNEVTAFQSFSSPELHWFQSSGELLPRPHYYPSVPMLALDVAISGQYAYLGEGLVGYDSLYGGRLTILDISNPHQPKRIGYFPMPQNGAPQNVLLDDNIAYLSSLDRYGPQYTIALDISNPEQPKQLASIPNGSLLAVHQGYAYFHDYENGLLVWDVFDPASPVFVGSLELPLVFSSYYSGAGVFISDIKFKNNFAYIAMEYGGLQIIDVSDPANIEFITIYGPP